ncbi:uncharacterized protein LOC105833808 isoform X2 [Monomorium pharaonis]|uniref:uncharacterized protein LOC105833808 isoform X2 n=1 Tax=Monomorium pharaonis TaxID=307658 RepID=UPI00174721B9|nr:uncharacterized protein LOC105833808 isoform X2 [Monomorium pharaonis]
MDKTEIQTTILFFAKARELTGCKECKLCLPRKLSSADLFDKIVHTFELQSIRNNLILAVNEEFVTPNSTLILSEKDKIAVIPPLSGGLWPVHLLSQQLLAMCIPPEIRRFWVAIGWQSNTLPGATFSVKAGRCPRARCHSTPLSLALFSDNMEVSKNFVKLQQEELNVSEIMRLVTFPNCGAISSFIGITRDNFEDKKIDEKFDRLYKVASNNFLTRFTTYYVPRILAYCGRIRQDLYRILNIIEKENICAILLLAHLLSVCNAARKGKGKRKDVSSSKKVNVRENYADVYSTKFSNSSVIQIWSVIKLEYEAYESMALKEMSNICDKIRLQWNVEGIAIYHRIGNVPISKASVVIAVSSPHREESLKAVEYAINTLKASVPIWKKEIYEIGESQWKQNKESLKKEDVQTAINEIVSNKDVIDANLIQVRANSEELNRRIESFIKRKRQQVNTMNVQEFCRYSEKSNDNENSCARVDAILIRRKDSKSHVKDASLKPLRMCEKRQPAWYRCVLAEGSHRIPQRGRPLWCWSGHSADSAKRDLESVLCRVPSRSAVMAPFVDLLPYPVQVLTERAVSSEYLYQPKREGPMDPTHLVHENRANRPDDPQISPRASQLLAPEVHYERRLKSFEGHSGG